MTLTNHVKLRMQQRVITLQDIYNAVKLGTPEPTENNRTKYTYNDIYVILSSDNVVVTTCFTNTYTSKIKKYAKVNSIGFYAAIRKLRGSCCR